MTEPATNPLVDAFRANAAAASASADAAVTNLIQGEPTKKATAKAASTATTIGDKVANGAKAVGESVSGFVAHPGESISDAGSSLEKFGEKVGNSAMDFGKNLSPTGIITGLLGVGGAYLIGSAFGGSFSWVITALLAPMMFLLGNKFGKDSVEPWISSFGDGSSKSSPSHSQQRQHEYGAQPIASQRGFNNASETHWGQQLQNAGFISQQRYAYDDGYAVRPAPYREEWPPALSYARGYQYDDCNTWRAPSKYYGSSWDRNSYDNDCGSNRSWNPHHSGGVDWINRGINGPRWVGSDINGPGWVGSDINGPKWNGGSHNPPPPPPTPTPPPPTEYIPPTIGNGSGSHGNGGEPFRKGGRQH